MKDKINFRPIREFLNSGARNAWIEVPPFRVYVRRGYHLIEGDIRSTLDVANVESATPGSGLFLELMTVIESEVRVNRIADIQILRAENVLNPRLAKWFRGFPRIWTEIGPSDNPCFYTWLRRPK